MFVVLLTGLPGSGKTACLTALSDALVDDEVAHAALEADEVAWAFPFPDNRERCEHLRACAESHRRAGQDLLLVTEVIESDGHLGEVLAAVGADDHLLVRLDADPDTLRERITAREPPGWHSLRWLLDYTERMRSALDRIEHVHLSLDSSHLPPAEIAARIREAAGR